MFRLSLALVCSVNIAWALVSPQGYTPSVAGGADDCAIWIHPDDSALSVIIGNDKKDPGGLYVWDMNGRQLQRTEPLPRPVNVDVRYGVPFGKERHDIVACGIRAANQIQVYRIDKDTRQLTDITHPSGISTQHARDTYGFALYRRPRDGALFAFVSQKHRHAIHQIRLTADAQGRVEGRLERVISGSDQQSFVEGICVDDALGFVYCCDETHAVLKYAADPDSPEQGLLGKFATGNTVKGDREGIALYEGPNGTGYVVLSSQGDHSLKVFRREGANAFVATIDKSGSTETDGVAVCSRPILPKYPQGLVACHNDQDNNYVLYSWQDLRRSFEN